jgi:hypothetical protein
VSEWAVVCVSELVCEWMINESGNSKRIGYLRLPLHGYDIVLIAIESTELYFHGYHMKISVPYNSTIKWEEYLWSNQEVPVLRSELQRRTFLTESIKLSLRTQIFGVNNKWNSNKLSSSQDLHIAVFHFAGNIYQKAISEHFKSTVWTISETVLSKSTLHPRKAAKARRGKI